MSGLKAMPAIVLGALAAFALPGALLSCARAARTTEAAPRKVSVALVERRDFRLESSFAARLMPAREVNVTPKAGGRVASVKASVGDRVGRGQVLLSLDASDLESSYRQATASVESAKANLERTKDAAQGQQVLTAQSTLDQAKVALDEATRAYTRATQLQAAGAIAQVQFDDAESRYQGASIQYDAAKQGLDLVRDRAGPQSSSIVSSQVDQARAQAELAKSQLDSAVIRSPIDGMVSYRNVEVGEMVGTSSIAFTVIDDSSFVAEAALSGSVVGLVSPSMRLSLRIEALGIAVEGRVDSVSPTADPRTLLYTVRIALPSSDPRMKAGMLAKLALPLATKPGAIVVPERAVFSDLGGDTVYVISEGAALKRRIELGESDGKSVEVVSGLTPGEQVITEGQEFIQSGERVQPAGPQ